MNWRERNSFWWGCLVGGVIMWNVAWFLASAATPEACKELKEMGRLK